MIRLGPILAKLLRANPTMTLWRQFVADAIRRQEDYARMADLEAARARIVICGTKADQVCVGIGAVVIGESQLDFRKAVAEYAADLRVGAHALRIVLSELGGSP